MDRLINTTLKNFFSLALSFSFAISQKTLSTLSPKNKFLFIEIILLWNEIIYVKTYCVIIYIYEGKTIL